MRRNTWPDVIGIGGRMFRNTHMAHVRRKFARVHKAQGSAIADEAIRRIADLYAVEEAARGLPPDKRTEIRQAEAKPVFNGFEAWLNGQLPNISA